MSICTNVYGKFVNLEKDRSSPTLGTRFGEQSWGWVMAAAGSLARPLCARPILLNGSVMIMAPGMFGRLCPGECGDAMSRPTAPSCHLPFIQLTPVWPRTHQDSLHTCPLLTSRSPIRQVGQGLSASLPDEGTEAQRWEETAQGHTAGQWQSFLG